MKLKEYLEETQTTQYRLAKNLGVPPAYIWKYLRGMHKPSPEMILKIQDLTGGRVTFDDWYRDEVGQ